MTSKRGDIKELNQLYKHEEQLQNYLDMEEYIICLGFFFKVKNPEQPDEGLPPQLFKFLREQSEPDMTITLADVTQRFGWRALEIYRDLMRERIVELEGRL